MNAIKLTWEDKAVNAVAVLIALVLLIVAAYPLYYVLINSLNDGADAASGNIYFYPRKFSLENYSMVFKQNYLITGLGMSVARTVVGTAAAVLVTAMAAYALTKENLRFRKLYLAMAIVTMYFSGGLIPLYFVLNELHLLNNFLVYVLPSLFTFFHCLLFMAFFRELPKELYESAYIDGANDLYIFFKLVIPLSMPVVATISLFVGVNHWNDYFVPSFFISRESLQTLPVILIRLLSLSEAQQQIQQYLGNHQSKVTMESLRYATLFVSILPITLLYPFVQRFFVKGMLVGSIKA
ncbi:carbohydrate ABC transporter permease [Cohnella phaseoli]|uniref:Putative aldouronate transport system permease protein n=1 Tax=Cohnella phaseoli TaxID=456490 RepID=A0A3D9KGU6_9BACL|nr:carbohydrate ABC transporter permease [Cohnella phaseoli]RED85377.1 putative aldouronate transport system permease protein [Cohnella phaseoli]